MQLFVDGRYTEVAQRTALPGVKIRSIGDVEAALSSIPLCGFEANDVSVGRFTGWKTRFKNTKFTQTSALVEGFRRSKDPEELSRIHRARRIAWEMVRRVPGVLRAGISERALAWRMEEWARELGAEKMSFEPVVAFGTHTSRPHHRGTARTLKRGHIVQVDLGVVYRGYCSDVSEVFFTARPTSEQERIIGVLREAKEKASDALTLGVSAADIDRIARTVLASAGIEDAFCHALGHGVGLDIHEGITLSPRSKEKLLHNEVVAIEPGVYFPGKFGMRVEDMVVIGNRERGTGREGG
jgi:Xaa-Pro aminopeptidase